MIAPASLAADADAAPIRWRNKRSTNGAFAAAAGALRDCSRHHRQATMSAHLNTIARADVKTERENGDNRAERQPERTFKTRHVLY